MKNIKKILFVNHDSEIGGASRSLVALIDELRLNYAVSPLLLIPSHGPIENLLQEKQVPYLVLKYRWLAVYKDFPLHNAKVFLGVNYACWKSYKAAAKELKKQYSKLDFDLVYSNSSVNGFGLYLAKKFGIKHIWHIREFGREDHNLIPATGETIFKILLRLSDKCIFISQGLKNKYFKKQSKKAKVVYNGIANSEQILANLKKRNQFGKNSSSSEFNFAMVGTLSPSKGQLDAIKAFKSFYEEFKVGKLIIAGKGHDEFQLQIEEEAATNEHIDFRGFLNNVEQVYMETDVFLMCSKNEAFGRVTVEAMSYGIPVIGYNNAGTAEIISSGKNGLLYNSHEELIDCMREVYKNKDAYHELSRTAVESAKSNFSLDSYVAGVWEVIQSV